MKKLYQSNNGFSIVQVLVAIALSGVLTLVVMKISQNMNSVQSEAEASQEENELKAEFRMILDNVDHCTVSLAGLDPVNSPTRFKKSDIDEPDNNEGLTVELFQKSSTGRTKRYTSNEDDTTPTLIWLKKIKIKSMKLSMPNPPINVNYPQATRHTDIGRLFITIEKNKRTKRLQLPLVITMKTDSSGESTILSCRSQATSDPCPALGMVMNQNTGSCRPRTTTPAGYARSSNYAGIWGGWGGWSMCTNNRMVCGIQTRVEDPQGGGGNDDTALNAVRLLCCNSLPFGRLNEEEIFSKQGGWGDWGAVSWCPLDSYALGFKLKQEPSQGGGTNDDTGTNAVILKCSDTSGTEISSKQGGWGNWDSFGLCPSDQYICGFRTRVEDYQGSGVAHGDDDTSFNGMEARCCEWTE